VSEGEGERVKEIVRESERERERERESEGWCALTNSEREIVR